MRRHFSRNVTISSMMLFKLEGVEWPFMSWRRQDLFGRTRFVSPYTYQVKMTQQFILSMYFDLCVRAYRTTVQ
jgi:hypothetical protein